MRNEPITTSTEVTSEEKEAAKKFFMHEHYIGEVLPKLRRDQIFIPSNYPNLTVPTPKAVQELLQFKIIPLQVYNTMLRHSQILWHLHGIAVREDTQEVVLRKRQENPSDNTAMSES